MNLPTLYKKNSKGSHQTWAISVNDNVITTRWGEVGGKVQETSDVISEGKNLGKKNETTPAQQALAEAQSQWENKLKKGYVQSLDAAEAGERDAIITGGIDVMLAHRFDEHGDKLTYPCLIQPKLDGHRCIAIVQDGKCTLWSRTRKPITGMPHIQKAVESLNLPDGTVFDGELYHHDYKDKFEKLSSFIRSATPKAGSEVVQYWIYDLPSDSSVQNIRSHKLKELLTFQLGEVKPRHPSLVYVETHPASDEEELLSVFQRHLTNKYEGAIARNASGKYVGKRSYDLLKIKEFQDAEFKVVGVEEGRGKLAGHAVFVLEHEGQTFKAKLVGDQDNLKQYWEDPSLAIGRMVTVKFFGFTAKNKPRLPVAMRFRDE
jgi:DNA ligase-1